MRDEATHQLVSKVEWIKDGTEADIIASRPHAAELGPDEDGEPITSSSCPPKARRISHPPSQIRANQSRSKCSVPPSPKRSSPGEPSACAATDPKYVIRTGKFASVTLARPVAIWRAAA